MAGKFIRNGEDGYWRVDCDGPYCTNAVTGETLDLLQRRGNFRFIGDQRRSFIRGGPRWVVTAFCSQRCMDELEREEQVLDMYRQEMIAESEVQTRPREFMDFGNYKQRGRTVIEAHIDKMRWWKHEGKRPRPERRLTPDRENRQ